MKDPLKRTRCAIPLFLLTLGSFPILVSAGNPVAAPTAEEVQPLEVGATLPAVKLHGSDGQEIDLNKAVEEKPSVIVFYRGGWCPYCNRHLSSIQETQTALIEKGFQVIAISPDDPEHIRKTIAEGQLSFRVLSDSKLEAAKALGVAFQVPLETIHKYLNEYHLDLSEYSGEDHGQLPVPAVFIVSTSQEILFSHHNPDYTDRLRPRALLEAADKVLAELAEEPGK